VRVKLLPEDGELYVYVESQARIDKALDSAEMLQAQLGTGQRAAAPAAFLLDIADEALCSRARFRAHQRTGESRLAWGTAEGSARAACGLYLHPRPGSTQKSPPPGGSLSIALEPDRYRSGEAVGVLSALFEVETAFRQPKVDLSIRRIHHQNNEERMIDKLSRHRAAGVEERDGRKGWLRFLRQISLWDKWICRGG